MARSENIQLEGFKELDDVFGQLSNSMGRAALRRAGGAAAQPMARTMRRLAPKDELDLSESIDVGTKLSPRQASLHRRMFGQSRDAVELFVGPGPDPAAHIQEFGSQFVSPQPFARPAFDQEWRGFLDKLKIELIDQLQRTLARVARKAARDSL